MMRMMVIVGVLMIPFAGYPFPKATKNHVDKFKLLARECMDFQQQPRVALSASSFLFRNCPAYVQLAKDCGLESLELIYEIYKKATKADLESRRLKPLMDLWMGIAHCGCYYDIPWVPRGIVEAWECGPEYYDEQVSFLLKEMRLAAKEGRKQDERVCQQLISCEGIFTFQKLFAELEEGREDVIEILKLVWRSPDSRPTKMDAKSLRAWWRDNRENYALPKQAPGFQKTKDIHRWKPSGK